MFLTLNGFWILVLSPILSTLYKYLGKHDKDLLVTSKFSLGLLMISLSFLFLKLSTLFANLNGQISPIWLAVFFLLYSLGELLVAALGVAMVAKNIT
jgi:POT family proton-dependent oligopeptide transporter